MVNCRQVFSVFFCLPWFVFRADLHLWPKTISLGFSWEFTFTECVINQIIFWKNKTKHQPNLLSLWERNKSFYRQISHIHLSKKHKKMVKIHLSASYKKHTLWRHATKSLCGQTFVEWNLSYNSKTLQENEEITGFKSSGWKDDISVMCLLLHVFHELAR